MKPTAPAPLEGHRSHRPPSLLALSDRMQISWQDITVRAPLEVGVQVLPVPLDHRHPAEVRHAHVDDAMGDDLVELILGDLLQLLDQRRAHQTLLLGAMTALA